jgi:hypothetical protein
VILTGGEWECDITVRTDVDRGVLTDAVDHETETTEFGNIRWAVCVKECTGIVAAVTVEGKTITGYAETCAIRIRFTCWSECEVRTSPDFVTVWWWTDVGKDLPAGMAIEIDTLPNGAVEI